MDLSPSVFALLLCVLPARLTLFTTLLEYILSVCICNNLCLVSLSSALTVLFLSPCHLSNQCLLSEAQGKSAKLPKSEIHSVGLNLPEQVCVGECDSEGKGLSV